MAVKSLNASATKLALVFLVYIAILAPPPMTAQMTAAPVPSPSSITEDISFQGCAPLILEATMCVADIVKSPFAPHPACCKAFSKINDCDPNFLKHIPPTDLNLIKKICSL